ncbi:MAG: effector binding domain-containing protein [Bacteroidota bacterium]
MAEEKPRLARLSAIIIQLQSKRLVTAKDLADKHDVSIRTIYRDIRTLEKSGIPIVTEEGRGYSMMEGYKLPPVMFTEEEAMAMITAEQLIRKNKDQSLTDHYESAVTKIKSILKFGQKTKTELLEQRLQIRNNQRGEKTSHYLIQLQSSIANYRLVHLDYLSLKDQQSQRLVEPFALYTTQDNWILVAFCRAKNAFRAFRLDRIQKMQLTGETFEPHGMSFEQYLEQCRKTWQSTPDIPLSQDASTFGMNQKNTIMQNVQIEPFKMIGIAVVTSNQNGQAAKDIGELWTKFLSENILEKIPNKLDHTVYCVYTDYEGDHEQPYRTIIGCKVHSLDHIPQKMIGKTFEGGTYVKTSARGHLMDGLVGKKWHEIWQSDLHRAYTADFELYGEKAQNPNDAEVDFFIAIK